VFKPFHNNEEGISLRTSIKTRKIAAFLIVLFLTLYISPFLPTTFAAETALTVSPNEGFVGDLINVNGTIETLSGNYSILFDSIEVANGTADNEGKFTDSFTIPHSINGTHTIQLQDITSATTDEASFVVKTAYYVKAVNVPDEPSQLQEGVQVEIRANITGGGTSKLYQHNITVTLPTPASSTYYNATLPLLTNENGTASNTLIYPTDFLPAGAHTNYTGTYQIRLYKNTTTIGAESSFFIGLTNATTYQRLDWVDIKAMNYTKTNENATVTIQFGNKTLLSQKVSAENGAIIYNWQIPINASMGSYKITVATAIQDGTIKPVLDVQNFTVPGISVKLLTTNLNSEPLGGVNATIYRIFQSQETKIASSFTNSSGWTVNTLDRGGNYSFKAFWKNVQVNETTPVLIQSDSSWTITCQIVHMEFTVKDGKTDLPMPFIYLNLNINYRTVTNVSQTETEIYLTNNTGKWILRNQLVKANYTIRAYRIELLFHNTTFTIPQGEKWFNISIVCPVYSLTVHVEDATQASLGGYPIEIYEFAGGLYNKTTTDLNSGNATFDSTFGLYKIRLYNIEGTIILNETYYSLIDANAFFILRSSIYNANLSVKVLDYLGRPMPNVKVKLERENVGQRELTTDGNGVAFFESIIGGDCLVSICISGETPTETVKVYVEKSTVATITLEKYMVIFGIVTETTQFGVFITLIVLIVLFTFFLLYRRRRQKTSTEK